MMKNEMGPFVRTTELDGQPGYVVVRYTMENGKWTTHALATSGEWVLRPEGFDFDAEVVLRG